MYTSLHDAIVRQKTNFQSSANNTDYIQGLNEHSDDLTTSP